MKNICFVLTLGVLLFLLVSFAHAEETTTAATVTAVSSPPPPHWCDATWPDRVRLASLRSRCISCYQRATEKKLSDNDWNKDFYSCVQPECDTNEERDKTGRCVCKAGNTYLKNERQVVKCVPACPSPKSDSKLWDVNWKSCHCKDTCSGANEVQDESTCECKCSDGTTLSVNTQGQKRCKTQCPTNHVYDESWSTCVCAVGGCSANEVRDTKTCECSCPYKYEKNIAGASKCLAKPCQSPFVYDTNFAKCVCPKACPSGVTQNPVDCSCSKCPTNAPYTAKNIDGLEKCVKRLCEGTKNVYDSLFTKCICPNKCDISNQITDDNCKCLCPASLPILAENVDGEKKCVANKCEVPQVYDKAFIKCGCQATCDIQGQTHDSQCSCACPKGQVIVENVDGQKKCMAVKCSDPKIYNKAFTACVCNVQCENGQTADDKCVCGCNVKGTYLYTNTDGVLKCAAECKSPFKYNSQWQCTCPKCPTVGQNQNTKTCECSCPSGMNEYPNIENRKACLAKGCRADQKLDEFFRCVCKSECAIGQKQDANDCSCSACPSGTTIAKNIDGKASCVPPESVCQSPQFFNKDWKCACANQCDVEGQIPQEDCKCQCSRETEAVFNVLDKQRCMRACPKKGQVYDRNWATCVCPRLCPVDGQTQTDTCDCVCPDQTVAAFNEKGLQRCLEGCPLNQVYDQTWKKCIDFCGEDEVMTLNAQGQGICAKPVVTEKPAELEQPAEQQPVEEVQEKEQEILAEPIVKPTEETIQEVVAAAQDETADITDQTDIGPLPIGLVKLAAIDITYDATPVQVGKVEIAAELLTTDELAAPERLSRGLISDKQLVFLDEKVEFLVEPEREEEDELYQIMQEIRAHVQKLQTLLEKLELVLQILQEELSILGVLKEVVKDLQDQATEDGVKQIIGMLSQRITLDRDITNENIILTKKALEQAIIDLGVAENNYYKHYDFRMQVLNTADEAKLRSNIMDNDRLYLKNIVFNTEENEQQQPTCTPCDTTTYKCSENSTAVFFYDETTGCGTCQCKPTFILDIKLPQDGHWPTGDEIKVESDGQARTDYEVLYDLKKKEQEVAADATPEEPTAQKQTTTTTTTTTQISQTQYGTNIVAELAKKINGESDASSKQLLTAEEEKQAVSAAGRELEPLPQVKYVQASIDNTHEQAANGNIRPISM
jgi:hypothetical protein